MWTLLFSMRQKSPTLDIPEGAIYSQIPGYNLYIKHKNPKNDMLYSMMIYDVTDGVGYPRVVAADSGRLSMTQDKKHLLLQLYQGDLYEDMKQGGSDQMGSDLFRRESFHEKEILIPYDATFTRMDDNTMKSQYIGKNISELQHTIDSVRLRVDSAGTQISKDLHSELVCGLPTSRVVYKNRVEIVEPIKPINLKSPLDLDSLMKALPLESQSVILNQAVTAAVGTQQEYVFKSYSMSDDNFTIRRHQIEMQKKFTLSLACLIFFFIGAPLGAIIRKGGLGTSIVISVLLFIFYYIIDNIGYKLAKEGRWQVWEGIWLSSAVLLPLGIFLTRKAVNDSAVFNPDAYRNFFRRIVGLHQTRKLMMKEVIIEEVEPQVAIDKIQSLKNSCSQFLDKYHRRQTYFNYLMYGYDKMSLRQISREVDDVVDYMSNSRSQLVINKAMDFPIIRQLLTYHLTNYPRLGLAFGIIFPIGLAMYVVGIRHQKNLKNDISTIIKVCDELQENFINVEQTK
jgi:lipopolysaccharide export system permease protein